MRRPLMRLVLVGGVALLAAGPVQGAICGFPGFVAVGEAGGSPTAYVALYSPTPPFAFTGVGSTVLGTDFGDSCLSFWTDSVLNGVPNFNAIYGTDSPSCSDAVCSSTPAFCSPTLCMVYP